MIFFSLAYFIVRIQYLICITYKIRVNRLFLLLLRILVNRRLLVVKFGRSQKLHTNFVQCREMGAPTPALFKGQLNFSSTLDHAAP